MVILEMVAERAVNNRGSSQFVVVVWFSYGCSPAGVSVLFPQQPWEDGGITIVIIGTIPPYEATESQMFEIDVTNATHKYVDTNTKCYDRVFSALSGYSIVQHKWDKKSRVRVSNFTINNDGGKRLIVHFCLKAGPKLDRYRGWLKGSVTTVEKKTIPEQPEKIGTIVVTRKGRYELPENDLEKFSRIEFFDTNRKLIVAGGVDEMILWTGTEALFKIFNESGKTILVVDK